MRAESKKCLLVCATALAVLAAAPAVATAQEGAIQLSSEDAGEHCNPCVVHFVSAEDTEVVLHVLGHEEVVSRCRDEFRAELYEGGNGHITEQQLGPPGDGGECTQQACDSGAEAEWPVTAAGELGPTISHFTMRFCLEPVGGGTERHCDAEVTIEEDGGHHLVLSQAQHCPISSGVESEVTGRWEGEEVPHTGAGEAETDIEVMHL